jgi:hypothetical protein
MKKVAFETLSLEKFKSTKVEQPGCIKGGYYCSTGSGSKNVTLVNGSTITIKWSADTQKYNDQTGQKDGGPMCHVDTDQSKAPDCNPVTLVSADNGDSGGFNMY